MKDALTKLLKTFLYARSLVLDCQSSGVATIFFCRPPPCELSKQLRVVLDRMVSDINAIIAVLVIHTLHPGRYDLFFKVKRAFINHAISYTIVIQEVQYARTAADRAAQRRTLRRSVRTPEVQGCRRTRATRTGTAAKRAMGGPRAPSPAATSRRAGAAIHRWLLSMR